MRTGATLSTLGKAAQGDLTGTGAGLFATKWSLSPGALVAGSLIPFDWLLAAWLPGLRMVLVDGLSTILVGSGAGDGAFWSCSAGFA